MIRCYCSTCGLYIIVPDQFEGGKGRCPRCDSSLRIPKRDAVNLPDSHKANIRFFAFPSAPAAGTTEKARAVTEKDGRSVKYKCNDCLERFESLNPDSPQAQTCPSCGTANTAVVKKDIAFHRPSDPDSGNSGADDRATAETTTDDTDDERDIQKRVHENIEMLRAKAEAEAKLADETATPEPTSSSYDTDTIAEQEDTTLESLPVTEDIPSDLYIPEALPADEGEVKTGSADGGGDGEPSRETPGSGQGHIDTRDREDGAPVKTLGQTSPVDQTEPRDTEEATRATDKKTAEKKSIPAGTVVDTTDQRIEKELQNKATAQETFEGLVSEAETSLDTIYGKIDALGRKTEHTTKQALAKIEEQKEAGEREIGTIIEREKNAQMEIEKARSVLRKAEAAYNDLVENREYLTIENREIVDKLEKRLRGFEQSIEQSSNRAKKDVDSRKFAVTKIIDGQKRRDSQDNTVGSERQAIRHETHRLREACEELLELISRRVESLSEAKTILQEFRDWEHSLADGSYSKMESASFMKKAGPPDAEPDVNNEETLDGGGVLHDDAQWRYKADGREHGPLPLKEIRRLILDRTLDGQTMVRHGEGFLWGPAGSFPELKEAVESIKKAEANGERKAAAPTTTLSEGCGIMIAVMIIVLACTATHAVIILFTEAVPDTISLSVNLALGGSSLLLLIFGSYFIIRHYREFTLSSTGLKTAMVMSIAGFFVCFATALVFSYLSIAAAPAEMLR